MNTGFVEIFHKWGYIEFDVADGKGGGVVKKNLHPLFHSLKFTLQPYLFM
jgi:hypothetical protein